MILCVYHARPLITLRPADGRAGFWRINRDRDRNYGWNPNLKSNNTPLRGLYQGM